MNCPTFLFQPFVLFELRAASCELLPIAVRRTGCPAYPITVTISMFASLGTPGGTVTQDLPAFGYVQINDILSQGTDLGTTPVIKVISVTKGAQYTAYASVVDNSSGDAIFLPAKK